MMSITSFQPSDIAASPVILRGRDSYFWKREIFKRIPDFQPDSEQGEKAFSFIIIFNPRLFLAIEPDGIEEIFEDLLRRDPERENLLSIEGKPFFALSNASFQKLRLNLTEDKDLINKLNKNGNVRTIPLKHPFQVLELYKEQRVAENVICYYQSQALISDGVQIEDFGHFYIEGMVPIGSGSTLGSGVVIKGDSRIGKNVKIYPHAYLENAIIGDNCTVLPGCIITDSTLEENVTVGPYTHLRMGSLVKQGAKMGNFVEMKKSILGEGSKSMHLTYIGDADIGKNVNIGAGTITCNYDGVNKNKTTIEDGVFIGSGTELVAPITVRKNSYVGAGSTITTEVPEDSLAIAREKQRNILGWASKRKKKDSCPK